MKKIQSLAFYALVTPVITLGASSLLAQQPAGHDADPQQQSTQQHDESSPAVTEGAQGTRSAGQPGSQSASDRANQYDSQSAAGLGNIGDQARGQNRGYMNSVPANGMHSSNLIGADVTTSGDEDVGSVSDLLIDEDGQIVAIIVGVGGFLGLGERDVAIGWDDVTKSGSADDLELRINATRDDLRSAPEFEKQD